MSTVITVSTYPPNMIPPSYTSLLSKIYRYNKNFNYSDYDLVGFPFVNNVDIGFIGFKETDNTVEVSIFQAPNICRMSILSLIESSVVMAKDYVVSTNTTKTIVFKNVHYSHTFKFNALFKDIYSRIDDDFTIESNDIKNVDISLITLKEIILEKM